MISSSQPWLKNARFDLSWIIAPAYISSFLVLIIMPLWYQQNSPFPIWIWVACVIGIDVSHVYSTLYRTYFDKEERGRYETLLFAIPVLCWVVGVFIHYISAKFFWSSLAYLAVFHFIRQQYGFVALYSRLENRTRAARCIDTCTVYMATLFPLVFWHTRLPRKFDWFVPGDFALRLPDLFAQLAFILWLLAFLLYLAKEVHRVYHGLPLNLPKNFFILGTALSWYVGIVLFNADLPFTITNVLSHGIPYIALVWLYERRKGQILDSKQGGSPSYFRLFAPSTVPVFLFILFILAYIEEALWDGLIWRDHKELFLWAWELPGLSDPRLLALIVPLLAVPQATHYVLDAFIWRIRKPESEVRTVLKETETL